ncbi:hypothetical protein VMCG_05300 [Cytospora schulzeri]|uniref:Myb-like domain-containing protein n=1 Tax=Cytospora schulzeri TaxID=448051 RepID=A0A423WR63_9PEZI|nr:hypothetical protein VMCG_05300 [Valsa malicola]
MSSDGHASDHSHSVVDESDELKSEAEEVTRQRTTHHRQGDQTAQSSPSTDEGSLDEEDEEVSAGHNHAVAKVDTAEEGDISDDGQHPSQNQEPPSHQVPSEDSEYSPHEAESGDSTDGQSEVGLVSKANDVRRTPKKSRKRKSPTSLTDGGDTEPRPLKKTKGPFNRAYLDLLNEDIEHAAAQYVPPHGTHDPYDERKGMPASQVGMTVWTPMEKERFFEALGRLGRDDAAGIARRVRTKGEMEVRQYLKLLRDGLALRRQQHELDPLELADFPAATELSHDCCRALEAAADSVALRQEHSEKAVELPRYGADWLVTQENCKGNGDGDGEPEGSSSVPAMFFNTPNYLKLSERLFMNGSTTDTNWRSVDGDPPSIRRTTLGDFHSLAVTLTRRLVAASIYMATSRIRAERGYKPNKPSVLREKDVHAAALSLGLGTETQSFLARCPRRLGLHVYEEPPKTTDGDSGEVREPMDYDDVETALDGSGPRALRRVRHEMERIALSSEDDAMYPDSEGENKADTASGKSESGTSDEDESDEEDEDIKAEADEVIFYSAVDQPQTKRDRQALFRRIKAEREQERYADAVDAQATYQEESRMWGLLGQPPPEPLVDPGSPPSGRRLKISVDAAYSVGKDWRAKTKVMRQWESQYRPHGW